MTGGTCAAAPCVQVMALTAGDVFLALGGARGEVQLAVLATQEERDRPGSR